MSPRRTATADPVVTRETVVDRALAVADAEGLEAVTMRRVATDLGVTPMALYWHLANKEELLAAMGDRIFAGLADRVDGAVASAPRWPDALRAVMRLLLDALRVHPGAVELAGPRILACHDGRVVTERALALLDEAGLDVRLAADMAHLGMLTAVMLVTSREPGAGGDREARSEVMSAKRAALKALPPGEFPRTVAAAEALTDCDDEELTYATGIDLYVAGVEALAATSRRR